MTTLTLQINGRDYAVASRNEDAPRLMALGHELGQRVERLKASLGTASASDAQLLVLVSLMLLDELDEAKKSRLAAPIAPPPAPAPDKAEEKLLVQAVEHLTGRVISIADRLRAA